MSESSMIRTDASGLYQEHRWLLAVGSGAASVAERWRALGWEVCTCPGPSAGHSCPVLEGGHCPVAAEAQLVVHAEPAPSVGGRQLRRRLAEQQPDLPVLDG